MNTFEQVKKLIDSPNFPTIKTIDVTDGLVRADWHDYLDSKEMRFDVAYLKMAKEWSYMSVAQRMKVGALLVRDHTIISDGFNGTISGFDNCCETTDGVTKDEVIHAEANCILKLTHNANTAPGSTMYLTLSPCKPCTALVIRAGVSRVVFADFYRDISSLEWIFKKNLRMTYINLRLINMLTNIEKESKIGLYKG